MASTQQLDSTRLYSWWWDSHMSPKNSKWLQDNLTDMDSKVKAMIKLIEEDADSFARRAEMYYKKRPELMKLVEEFYRAYRALSERYDHATGELRQAHRTMSQAFPDQVPFVMGDDPENCSEASDGGSTRMSRKGLKHLNDMYRSVEMAEKGIGDLSQESERADKAETELKKLKEVLAKLEAEKNAISDKLSTLEKNLSDMQNDSSGLDMVSHEAKSEIQDLKEALKNMEAERDASLFQYRQTREELYIEYVVKIASLEKKLQLAEESLKMLTEQYKKTESEVKNLKEEISRVKEEKDDVTFRYKQCLETISRLENELSEARAENVRLNSEVVLGFAKLKGAEDQCESLHLEAQRLSKKIGAADEELSRKQSELEKVTLSLEDERCRFVEAEATLHTLQNLYSQSQEELQMMKDLVICKRNLEAEIEKLKHENKSINDLNSSSSVSQKNLQDELLKLKGKLEAEVMHQAEHSDALQFQVKNLKEEIEGLYGRYEGLMKQVESAGLDPESFGSSVKTLRAENSRLEEIIMKEKAEREALLEKLRDIDELFMKNVTLERSLSEVNVELGHSKAEAMALKESRREMSEDKTALFSQLRIITETMQSLVENNTLLQTSLCSATAELEGLRAKSKGLEEFCQLLISERSNLQTERNSLVSRLEIVEKKLDKLEMRFTNLEDKYDGLVQEKQCTVSQAEELKIWLDFEKKERANLLFSSEARLSGLENRVQDLQVENKYRKKEFEEQLEKAVNAQVEIFILQKFIQDMEDKNRSLLVECQRHVEGSKYSEKLIVELEGENMMQELEAEILLDKIEMLREGLVQVLKALEIKQGSENELERNFVPFVLSSIRNMKKSLSESKDENQQLLIEKSVLSTLLGQLHIECYELSSKKTSLEQESLTSTKKITTLDNEKNRLLEKSRQLNMEVDERERREVALKSEVKYLRGSYLALQEEKDMLEEENAVILIDALAFGYQSVILKSFAGEKSSEFENETKQLKEELLMKETENSDLKASIQTLEEKHLDLSASNYNLSRQISEKKSSLNEKELELSEAKQKLNAVEAMKEKEIAHLLEANGSLECEAAQLHEEIEEYKIREVILTLELQELGSDFELWEAEATSFYFDLQISTVREVLLEKKVHELESEAQELKSQLTTCLPVIDSLKDHIALLENSPALQTNPLADGGTEKEEIFCETEESSSSSSLSSSSPSPDVIHELQKLKSRIKVIEDILNSEKESVSIREQETADIMLKSALNEIQDLRSRISTLNQDEYQRTTRESLPGTSQVKTGTEMKDIPLDRSASRGISQRVGSGESEEQIIGLWEDADKENTSEIEIESQILDESNLNPTPESHFEMELRVDSLGSLRKGSTKTAMEILTSNAQKLMNLQISVQELKRKIEPKKRMRKTKDNSQYESLRVQLVTLENSVVDLMDVNTELMKSLEENSLISETESEKAKDETEKVTRLELEVQRIEYTLMRLMDEQKVKLKGNSRSSATMLLRGFFYSRERKSKKPKKSWFCGCMRSSAAKS